MVGAQQGHSRGCPIATKLGMVSNVDPKVISYIAEDFLILIFLAD